MRKRILVCGGRDFNDIEAVMEVLGQQPRDSIIINGAATGADTLAEVAVKRLNGEFGFNMWYWSCAADWPRLRYAAGPIRNGEMLEETRPTLVIAFPGGK